MTNRILFLLVILLGFAESVSAVGTSYRPIQAVKPFGGGIQINLANYKNETGVQCEKANFFLQGDQPEYESKRDLLYAALAAHRHVAFTFYGCHTVGSAEFIKVSSVLVGNPGVPGGNTQEAGNVQRVFPHSGRVYFRIAGSECVDPALGEYFYFETADLAAEQWFSMLLSAANIGNPIRVAAKCERPTTDARHVLISYLYQDFL